MSTPSSSSSHPSGKPIIKPKGGSADADAKLSFEAALAKIESIIERIEAGEVGLEESLAEYERGVALINHCRGKLDHAKQKVEDLTRKLSTADEEQPGTGTAKGGKKSPDSGGAAQEAAESDERDEAEPPF